MTDNPSLFTDPLVLSGKRFTHGLARLREASISGQFVPSQSLSVYVDSKGRVNVNGPILSYETVDPLNCTEVPLFSPDNKFIKGLEKAINIVSVEPYWVETSAGIHTLSNVGIGTTNPTSPLTVSGNADISGAVTASSFAGDGSGLTGIVAIGTGVEVRDGGSLLGTAATINFANNLSVSFSGGVATINSTFTDTNYWEQTSAGIHTLSNVGIGTTNPTSPLTVSGNANISGAVTASSFIGDGSGLTGIVATGTGVEIRDNGSLIGNTAVINFGNNLSVNFSSNIATITATTGTATDSERLNGELPSYYLNYNNFTNTPTNLSNFNNDVGFTTFSPAGRISITQTTGVLGSGGVANLTFANGFSEYKLLKASASVGAWITIYTDTQSRTNDGSRSIDTDPLPGSGVIAELITTGTGSTTQKFTPAVTGYNDDPTVSNNIYAKVVNNSGISTQITVTLTIAD